MSPILNPRIILAKLPGDEYPIPGEHLVYDDTQTIDLATVPLRGGFLTKTLVLSPEPYMRGRMRDPSIPSYSTTFIVGQPLIGTAIVVVLRSEDETVKVGDHMIGLSLWEAYTVQPYPRRSFRPEDWAPWTFDLDSLPLRPVRNPGNLIRWETFCGALGTPGATAWVGFEEYSNAQEGETMFVSSGASGVGQMVIQLGKMKGLKVIASAGSTEKVEYLKELGADVAFNYKEVKTNDVLREHGPLNIYWDNVGGATLEAAIAHSTRHARIIMCGSVSEYNIPYEQRYGVRNLTEIWQRCISMHGLLLGDLLPKYSHRFYAEVPPLIAQGKIKAQEHVTRGLRNAPEVFVQMLREGGTLGKPVIVLD